MGAKHIAVAVAHIHSRGGERDSSRIEWRERWCGTDCVRHAVHLDGTLNMRVNGGGKLRDSRSMYESLARPSSDQNSITVNGAS